jgi:hypothetical protein
MKTQLQTIRVSALLGAFLCGLSLACARAQAPATLAPGTTVKLILVDRLKSGDSKKGERVNLRVDEDIVDTAGTVLIRRGTPAVGTVTQSRHNGLFGRRGLLSISIDYTAAVDGQRVPLRAVAEKTGKSNSGGSIALFSLVTPLGFFVKGTNAGVEPGTALLATVDDTVRVNTSAASPGYGGAPAVPAGTPSDFNGPLVALTLLNGDRISGRLESLVSGIYTVTTANGLLKVPAANVRTISDMMGVRPQAR